MPLNYKLNENAYSTIKMLRNVYSSSLDYFHKDDQLLADVAQLGCIFAQSFENYTFMDYDDQLKLFSKIENKDFMMKIKQD